MDIFVPQDSYPSPGQQTERFQNNGEGTILISGRTSPAKAANVAFERWRRGRTQIEFFFIGANAGNQAWKSASILIRLLWHHHRIPAVVVPRWALTETTDPDGRTEDKEGIVLRVVQIPLEIVRPS